jgi:hypothetical protein
MNHRAKHWIKPFFFIAVVAALGAVVMLLWNAIVPDLFTAAQPIDYLHALGLLVLCRILFGGFRGHGGWHRGMHGHGHWAKWKAMTPEEREKFRHEHRHEHR